MDLKFFTNYFITKASEARGDRGRGGEAVPGSGCGLLAALYHRHHRRGRRGGGPRAGARLPRLPLQEQGQGEEGLRVPSGEIEIPLIPGLTMRPFPGSVNSAPAVAFVIHFGFKNLIIYL